ncbi:hypothetical protein [Aeromonas veronii]|uniref:hypothetical protein n=1 Tax=Aeromonas veronii TaxID=654 RepID=UPI001E2D61D8|nr:hypothetical protein [Aeromonas veronii]MCD6619984.1 hypothetical protein [Aeromonas veronii]
MFQINQLKQNGMMDIARFISQEAYRLAVIKQYPEDVSRIYNLSKSVRYEILKLFKKNTNIDYAIESIILCVVCYIVTKPPFDEFKNEIRYLINRWWGIESEDDNDDIINNDKNELLDNLKKTVIELCKSNQNFKCNIAHRYSVAMFATEFDSTYLLNYYHDTLRYIYKKEYLPIRKNCVPTLSVRRYKLFNPIGERPLYSIECAYQQVEVPTSALSRIDGDIIINGDIENLFDSYMMMHDYRNQEYVDIATKLTVQIDISNMLSNNELDRIMSYLRSDISVIQTKNKISHMCLAKTEDELVEKYNIPSLHTDDYPTVNYLHRADTLKSINESHAKNYLCALILIAEHFVKYTNKNDKVKILWKKDEKNSNLKNSMDLLATALRDKYGDKTFNSNKIDSNYTSDFAGFSAGMIERGYKELNKLIKKHLDFFQQGRVQFGKKLNSSQRDKLRAELEISLDKLHPDDKVKAKDELETHLKNGRQASVKPLKNGSYVITW